MVQQTSSQPLQTSQPTSCFWVSQQWFLVWIRCKWSNRPAHSHSRPASRHHVPQQWCLVWVSCIWSQWISSQPLQTSQPTSCSSTMMFSLDQLYMVPTDQLAAAPDQPAYIMFLNNNGLIRINMSQPAPRHPRPANIRIVAQLLCLQCTYVCS